jgi:hypothetical protein
MSARRSKLRAVRSLLLLTVLAACELKPPPPKADVPVAAGSAVQAKAPAIAPTPAPPPPPPAPVPVPVPLPTNMGAGSAAQPAISDACATLAVHITDVLIANAEPSQRAFLEQERGRTVRQSGVSCQRNNWNAEKIKCFSAAMKAADLDTCNKMP